MGKKEESVEEKTEKHDLVEIYGHVNEFVKFLEEQINNNEEKEK